MTSSLTSLLVLGLGVKAAKETGDREKCLNNLHWSQTHTNCPISYATVVSGFPSVYSLVSPIVTGSWSLSLHAGAYDPPNSSLSGSCELGLLLLSLHCISILCSCCNLICLFPHVSVSVSPPGASPLCVFEVPFLWEEGGQSQNKAKDPFTISAK